MVIEELTESAVAPSMETGTAASPEEQSQQVAEEAAEFITRQILDRGATFRDG